ncbi:MULTISPECIES: SDR family NAD(P)-dependent oxidoreductase [Limibacillus]|jgi:NAD(P)-dependent dehydrogenase (short-subunit alcohol dehydrogenase family)|uniref:NAD(P)-dependent dehydrogenase (Short-subunit alcohol dehydrogenase family) n=1 Tax=Limibacillus halophilus TaxID=1579333 RepID=A0A839SSE2_9PROT|nr:SDR family NAD(P)-dependent oxidoreductase [Limibacillus halophilus]MBB3063823.1 NAD(P)-dependent dehydrogenase (short-subunit alcohol dehydrogenase family) [Limibacillus halophilus]
MATKENQRVILITGCSSGIGLAAARGLNERGWKVFATCRKQEDCDRLEAEGLRSFRLDYEVPETIESAFRQTLDESGGRLDAVFNNGAYAIPGAVEDLPTAALKQIFEANFFGWHSLIRLALPVMRAQGSGRIVQNSSVLGIAALTFRGAYNATKFAVEGLTDTLRLELRGLPIEVILIEPGPINTKIRINAYPNFKRWIDWRNSPNRHLYETALIPRLEAETLPTPFELQPEAVVRKLVHALESARPRPRYYVTTPTYIMGWARRLLPTRALDWLAAKASS